MRSLTRALVATSILVALVLGGATAAYGAYSLTVTTRPAVVTYPHASRVIVGLDGFASAPTTVTMQYRRVDGGDWATWSKRVIRAKQSAEATSFFFTATPPWLNQTTEFRALVSGVATSNVATITVKARITQPQVAFSQPRKKVPRTVQFRGLIWPAHLKASDVVTLTFWKLVGRTWVARPDLTLQASISRWKFWLPWDRRTFDFASKWQVTVPVSQFDNPVNRSRWRVQASHADTAHAPSQAAAQWFWIR